MPQYKERNQTQDASLPALPRAEAGNYRIRYDHVDSAGKLSLRRAGKMHHLGIGVAHQHKRVIMLIDEHTVTVVHLDTGEVITTNTIDPGRVYWRNQQREPGRWPDSR